MNDTHDIISAGLVSALKRAKVKKPRNPSRLTGGTRMESWRFDTDKGPMVLRRAPAQASPDRRAFDMGVEAQIIRAAALAGVAVPNIVCELQAEDGIGNGFIMEALPGTADPQAILETDRPETLLTQVAEQLAAIHRIDSGTMPPELPRLRQQEGLDALTRQFEDYGGDRPIVALALTWLRANALAPMEPGLVHGDFRMGNLMVQDNRLTGVLDWELAHRGDYHEDLAYACLMVWRFNRIDRPALGLGSMEQWLQAYRNAGGAAVDRERLHFWMVYRTCWWALGCLEMAQHWRDGDRQVERLVISRRAAEQELDLLMLIDVAAPLAERDRTLPPSEIAIPSPMGEANPAEIATAVTDWLAAIEDDLSPHDRFQLTVARDAVEILARNAVSPVDPHDKILAGDIMARRVDLSTEGLLAHLRRTALDKLEVDTPGYPALAVARGLWEKAR